MNGNESVGEGAVTGPVTGKGSSGRSYRTWWSGRADAAAARLEVSERTCVER